MECGTGAVETDPTTTPHVAWEAANFFSKGDQEKALRNFRMVLPEQTQRWLIWLSSCVGAQPEMPTRFLTRHSHTDRISIFSFSPLAYLEKRSYRCRECLEPSDRIKSGVFDESDIPLFSISHRGERSCGSTNFAWRLMASLNRSLQAISPLS